MVDWFCPNVVERVRAASRPGRRSLRPYSRSRAFRRPSLCEVLEEHAPVDAWIGEIVVHSAAPVGGAVPLEDAVEDRGVAALVPHAAPEDRAAAGNREVLQNGVVPLATHAAHDGLVESAAVDGRKLGPPAAAERDGFALEVDGPWVAARCDEGLVPGSRRVDGGLNRGVIPGNLDHGGSDRSAGPGNQGDENESTGVGSLFGVPRARFLCPCRP